MGIFQSCCEKGGYEKIDEKVAEAEKGEFHEVADISQANDTSQFKSNSDVFQGLMLDQKFTSSKTFDRRFIWVNLETRTLHMSVHKTKERRHKEASLADVTSVDTKPPQRYKKVDENESDQTAELYMTVHFVRGGGIDLRFETTEERNEWYNTFTVFVDQNKLLKSPRVQQ